MRWEKKGVIFAANKNFDWMVSHAQIPVVDPIRSNVLRIYFGTRDRNGRSHPAYVEVDPSDPQRILRICETAVLPLGEVGTFDDNGITPSWIVDHNNKRYLYYIGWRPQVTVPYHLSIGLAISENRGESYRKFSAGPILDRDIDEPYFNTAPCVLVDRDIWRMWYVSCTRWQTIKGKLEPFYNVKYAESSDGIHWRRTANTCIDNDHFAEAIGRPCVFLQDKLYKMIYSYRSATDYRTDRKQSYRLGYAESSDGINWERRDDEVGIDRSDAGWDSEMMAYSYVYHCDDRTYMFYNGNGFGKSGFGYALLGS